jgi:exopolysaccharide biosynthesis polyprenyl glycosylphosphotransferase
MSSPSLHPRQKPKGTEWAARLIPGTASRWNGRRPKLSPMGESASSRSIEAIRANQVVRKLGYFLRAWRGFKNSKNGKNWVRSARTWVVGMSLFGRLWDRRRVNMAGQLGMYSSRGMRNVLVVGAGGLGQQIAKYLETHPETERTFCGFVDDRKPLGKGVIGRPSDLAELARAGFVDEIILAAPHARELTLRVLHTAQQLRLDVKLAPDLFGCEPTRGTERIGGIPLISLHEEHLPVALLFKRALDMAGAGAALLLLAPALALLGLLIKLDSPGPVLYAAPRAGRKGKPFLCYKFRTMVKDAEALKRSLRERNERQGPFFKIKDDPRITKVGRFLRRYSLDELPQLWNVLKGEMSLVGPRPHPLEDFSGYAIEHLPRLDVTPGMTGLWQVSARENPSFQAGLNLDLEYIQRWNLVMDLRILLKTAGAVLRGSGQ